VDKSHSSFIDSLKVLKNNGSILKQIQKHFKINSYKKFLNYLEEHFEITQAYYEEFYQLKHIQLEKGDKTKYSFRIDSGDFSNWRNNKLPIPKHFIDIFSRVFNIPYDTWIYKKDSAIKQFAKGNSEKNILKIIIDSQGLNQSKFLYTINSYVEDNIDEFKEFTNPYISKPLLSRILKESDKPITNRVKRIIEKSLNLDTTIWLEENNKQILELTFKTADEYYQYAKMYCEHGNMDRALEVCKESQKRFPNNCEFYNLESNLHKKTGNFPKEIFSKQNYENCKMDKDLLHSFESYRNEAFKYFETDFSKSYEYFEKTLNSQPNIFFDYHNILELCLIHDKPFDKDIEKAFNFFFRDNERNADATVIFELLKIIYNVKLGYIENNNFDKKIQCTMQKWNQNNLDAWIGDWSIASLVDIAQDDKKIDKQIKSVINLAKSHRDEIVL